MDYRKIIGISLMLCMLLYTVYALPGKDFSPERSNVTKRVFVTSNTTNGDLGGLGGAISKCYVAASNANLTGTWIPWISAKNATTTIHAINALTPAKYETLNGVVVADSLRDLVDGDIQNPINVTEFGDSIFSTMRVLTGTNARGKATGFDCNSWTNGTFAESGTRGSTINTNSSWTDFGPSGCQLQRRLYCFEA